MLVGFELFSLCLLQFVDYFTDEFQMLIRVVFSSHQSEHTSRVCFC